MKLRIVNYLFAILISIFEVYGSKDDCVTISQKTHQVNLEDFKVTRYDDKYVMCAACYGSILPTIIPLQLSVHQINSSDNNVRLIVYMGPETVRFTIPCSSCQYNVSNKALTDLDQPDECITCPTINPSKGVVEIHFQLDRAANFTTAEKSCLMDMNFNMTVKEFSCNEGVAINLLSTDECKISPSHLALESKMKCIKIFRFKQMELNSNHIFYNDSFILNNSEDFYLWNVTLLSPKTLTINFSENIKDFLTVFDDSMLKPSWNVKQCTLNDTFINIEPTSQNIFILHQNKKNISRKDAFISFGFLKYFCNLPKTLLNGQVNLQTIEDKQLAVFSCYQGYTLIGKHSISCDDEITLPICVPIESEDSQESTYGFKNNASEIDLDQPVIVTTMVPPAETEFPSIDGSGFYPITQDEEVQTDITDFDESNSSSISLNGSSSYDVNLPESRLNFSNPLFNNSLDDLVLFSLSSFQENLIVFVTVGSGMVVVIIIIVISLIICKNRSARSNLNRKFDTFQNPIYEKSVVPLPETEGCDPSLQKLDSGNLSDSTMLE